MAEFIGWILGLGLIGWLAWDWHVRVLAAQRDELLTLLEDSIATSTRLMQRNHRLSQGAAQHHSPLHEYMRKVPK